MQRIPVSIRLVTIMGMLSAVIFSACGTRSSSSGTFSINQSCGTRYAATAGETIEVHYGEWGALGSELAKDNGQHITVRLVVDDQEVVGVQGPIISCDAIVEHFCGIGPGYCADGSFWLISKATIGPLSPGEHDVLITYILDEQISDGYDSNRDGENDTFGPGEWGQRRYTIVAK